MSHAIQSAPAYLLLLAIACAEPEVPGGGGGGDDAVVQDLEVLATATDTTEELILGVVEGASATLTRTEDALSLDGSTNTLEPGAYTVWWVIVNTPQCLGTTGDGACDPDVAAVWATGEVVGADGAMAFSATLGPDGPQGEVLYVPELGLTSDGLHSPLDALVKIVFRWHGPVSADGGELESQLNTVNGMCAENFPEMTASTGAPFCPQPQLIVAPAG